MTFLGIDPGKSGGIALVDPEGALLEAHKMPGTDTDCWELLQDLVKGCRAAALEKVHAMPKQGVSSTFKFGDSYGFLRGLLVASQVSRVEVTPGKWQGLLGCRSGGDKNVTKAKAQELWPGHKWTHAISDAALIAEWCRRDWLSNGGIGA